MTRKPEEPLMPENESLSNFEEQKIELVKMRIKNKYYDRDDILAQVVSEILHKDIRKKN